MNIREFERLVRKYYGYVADLEGSGVEAFDLLFVRDKIQRILDESDPETTVPRPLYEQVFAMDRLLWQEKEIFLTVVGERELRLARQQQGSRRSQWWWWYLDELVAPPELIQVQQERLVHVFATTSA